MILSAAKLCESIRRGNDDPHNGLAVIPCPDLKEIESSGEASVSLRLGRWFITMRQSGETDIDLTPGKAIGENKISKRHFVPFGKTFVLHPGRLHRESQKFQPVVFWR